MTPRDVLVDRIKEWTGDDWKIYDYADRLLMDLHNAGFEVSRREKEDQ